ncbi:pantothenate kinase [Ectocarpus siliculosus]|uniref:Type III pantothenate kinase n=1 Tax=Ectocarpus siliculosus TaxID=2880 RepID=D7FW81_ECTSI|nr:pantothenate kinase [Ectocarpus siliculosus]|eukprot:CBJ25601.1 pantothenate kinase [Ectocarpus siliculosus]
MEHGMWLCLMIGNSRLHWALLERDDVMEMWDTGHLRKDDGIEGPTATSGAVQEGIPLSLMSSRVGQTVDDGVPPTGDGGNASTCYTADPRRFKVASVVPEELERWRRRCPGISPISSTDALAGVQEYPTLGVDRALAVRGAARMRGWPVLVIDCGSALTFTAADASGRLAGGAILPGVRLQLAVLGSRTAQLPSDVVLPDELPLRWAMGTSGGIQAGVMWTIVAGIHSFIKDRWKIDPDATVIFTGGDGQVLHRAVVDFWEAEGPDLVRVRNRLEFVREVIHWGIASLELGKGSDS